MIDWANTDDGLTGFIQLGHGHGAPPRLQASGVWSGSSVVLNLETTQLWVPISAIEALTTLGLNGTMVVGPSGQLDLRASGGSNDVVLVADERLAVRRCARRITTRRFARR